jgi:hypothetical protein
MIEAVLTGSGFVLLVAGVARAYAASRAAIGPFVHTGEPTRAAIDAARPVVARSRVRRLVRSTAVAVGWLVLAGYGLFLASVGLGR